MSEEKKGKSIGEILKKSYVWGSLLFVGLILIDLLTKLWAQSYFTGADAPEQVDIIPGWISLRLTYNRGIAYGMGDSAPTWAKLAVIFGTAALMVVCGVLFFKVGNKRTLMKVALVFVIAGGVGNFIDRVYYRVWDTSTFPYGVRDMVDLSRFGFAVCNFADFFISAGAVMLVLVFLFFDKEAIFPVGKYKKLAEEEAQKQADEEQKNG